MEYQIYTSTCEGDTFQLGVDMASTLLPGDTVAFYGDLGSGKTEFIKGICTGLNVEDLIASPTFTIVNEYAGANDIGENIPVYHIDLYRIESVEQLLEIGMEEMLAEPDAIKLIEWSEHGGEVLPGKRYEVRFATLEDEDCRRIEVKLRGNLPTLRSQTEQVFSG